MCSIGIEYLFELRIVIENSVNDFPALVSADTPTR